MFFSTNKQPLKPWAISEPTNTQIMALQSEIQQLVIELKTSTPQADSHLDPYRFESLAISTQSELITIKKNMGLGPRTEVLSIENNVEFFASFAPSVYLRTILEHGVLEDTTAYWQELLENLEESYLKLLEPEELDWSETAKDSFGIFIQNEERQIVGGIFCKNQETKLYIDLLWIHPTMRGRKFANTLCALAEQFGKLKKCTEADVLTASFEASWLYPKFGYKEVSSTPIGDHTHYHYKKLL